MKSLPVPVPVGADRNWNWKSFDSFSVGGGDGGGGGFGGSVKAAGDFRERCQTRPQRPPPVVLWLAGQLDPSATLESEIIDFSH